MSAPLSLKPINKLSTMNTAQHKNTGHMSERIICVPIIELVCMLSCPTFLQFVRTKLEKHKKIVIQPVFRISDPAVAELDGKNWN